jgi:hypothetical protein
MSALVERKYVRSPSCLVCVHNPFALSCTPPFSVHMHFCVCAEREREFERERESLREREFFRERETRCTSLLLHTGFPSLVFTRCCATQHKLDKAQLIQVCKSNTREFRLVCASVSELCFPAKASRRSSAAPSKPAAVSTGATSSSDTGPHPSSGSSSRPSSVRPKALLNEALTERTRALEEEELSDLEGEEQCDDAADLVCCVCGEVWCAGLVRSEVRW